MTDPWVERILKARVYDVAVETHLDAMPRLSSRTGNEVLLMGRALNVRLRIGF